MKILIDINHPAHVHLFRHFANRMTADGHEVFFTTREKEISSYLLKHFGFNFVSFGKHYKSLFGKLWGLLKFDYKLYKTAKKFKPDLFLSMGSMYAAQVSVFMRKPHIALDDTEHKTSHHILYVPFSDVLVNPACFTKDFGKKQIRYEGFHELAYLHPNYFTPNPGILDTLKVAPGEKYVVLRFVSWDASHDVGQSGFSFSMKQKIVNRLSRDYKVFISSETPLPGAFRGYALSTRPEEIHDVLHYASLYIGESPTMTTESALLGTPAICVSSWAYYCGNFKDLKQYGLIDCCRPPEEGSVLNRALQLLEDPGTPEEWIQKRDNLLKDKTDVTAFLVWLIKEYPGSIETLKKNPRIQFERPQQ